jgi:hypothetical protein
MVDQLPAVRMPDPNPYSVQVPESVRRLNPELYEFLRKLTTTLRDEHNRTQAGDTTFDWQMMLGLDDLPRFTLGSLGSFSHPQFGLIRGRYVRFSSIQNKPDYSPVGFVAGPLSLEWQFTNILGSAQDSACRGLIASYVPPRIGQYGWIITEGVNFTALFLTENPGSGDTVQWGESPIGRYLGTGAEKVGDFYKVSAGTVRIGLEGTVSLMTGGADNAFDLGYGKQIREIRRRLDLQGAQSQLFIELLSRQITELTDDRASVELLDQIQAAANWANLGNTALKNIERYSRLTDIAAQSAQSILRDVRAYRNEAGFFAESSIQFNSAASLNMAAASVSAGQAAEASLTAEGYAAQALEYSQLAASTGGENLIKNGTFGSPAEWIAHPMGLIPPEYGYWNGTQGYGAFVKVSPGQYSPYAFEMVRPGDNIEIGIYQRVVVRPGNWIFGCDVENIDGGSLIDAGIHINYYNDAGNLVGSGAGARISFGNDPDLTGVVRNTGEKGVIFSYAIPVTVPAGATVAMVYMMGRWGGFMGYNETAPTRMRFHRFYLKAGSYSADSGAKGYTDAQIGIVNQALATETQARASADTNLRATFYGKNYDDAGRNVFFSDWPDGANEPTHWDYWTGIATQNYRQAPSFYGPYYVGMEAGGNVNGQGLRQIIPLSPGQWNLGCDVMFTYGDSYGAGMLVQFYRSDGSYINESNLFFNRDPRTDGGVLGLEFNTLYRWSIPVNAPPGTDYCAVYLMARWNGFAVNPNGIGMKWLYAGIKKTGSDRIYNDARVKTALDAVANEAGARAQAIQDVYTSVGNNYVNVNTFSQSINGITGRWGVQIDAGGRVTGFELLGGQQSTEFNISVDRFKMTTPGGTVTPFEVSGTQFRLGVDLYVGRFKIILDTGGVMLVMGLGFGNAAQFIMWFGPSMNPASCSEGNAIFYLSLNGAAYFGGALNAGIITNAKRTSSLAADAGVTTGQFGSNGKQRVVTVSYEFRFNSSVSGQCPAQIGPFVDVNLYRGESDQGSNYITGARFNGTYFCEPGRPGEPGTTYTVIQGSFTYTDNTGGLQAAYYAKLFNRTANASPQQQVLGIVSVEQ